MKGKNEKTFGNKQSKKKKKRKNVTRNKWHRIVMGETESFAYDAEKCKGNRRIKNWSALDLTDVK